jgi:hypothetical protein
MTSLDVADPLHSHLYEVPERSVVILVRPKANQSLAG